MGTSVAPRCENSTRSHTTTTFAAAVAAAVVTAVVALAASGTWSPPPASAQTLQGPIDTSSRDAVTTAYRQWYLPTQSVPVGWTGSAQGCDAGGTSPEATESAVNYFRAMAGLEPVTMDPALAPGAQQAALVMYANGALSHAPPSSWACWTQAAADTAARSNLALGVAGAEAVSLYMLDPGTPNASVGHRRWLLNPVATTMGTGSTVGSNALVVVGTGRRPRSDPPEVVPWPSPGWFPAELEPGGRWSVSLADADFSTATVTVTGPAGALPVTVNPLVCCRADNTLSFEVGGLDISGAERSYHVQVADVGVGTGRRTLEWTTTLFAAAEPPPPPTLPPASTLPPPQNRPPAGALEMLVVRNRRVTLGGWAADPDVPGGGLAVVVASTSGQTAWVTATSWRGDVEWLGLPAASGWVAGVELPRGSHTVCAAALDHDGSRYTGGSRFLGCARVVVK